MLATGPAGQAAGAAPGSGSVRIKSDVTVNGTVSAKALDAKTITVQGDASISTITASRVQATLVSADVVEAAIIRSPTGTITIDGNLALSSHPSAVSFLAMDVVVDGVRQWRLVQHDDFERGAEGWSITARSTCGSEDQFLGGPCVVAGDEASKVFTGLPAHTQVRITARFHFVDNWAGETAFAKVDGKFVWLDSSGLPGQQLPLGLDVCGAAFPERRLSVPVDAVLAHSGDAISVTFGSTLRTDACQASWGVDDVMVYVR